MKVLLAHKFFHYTGGADVFFMETGRILKEQGHQVAYLASRHPDNMKSEYDQFFPSPPVYEGQGGVKKASKLRQALNLPKSIYSLEAKRKCKELIDFFRPDVLHAFAINVHLTPAIFDACREKGVPVVLSCNDWKLVCPNYQLYHHGHICEECRGGRYYRPLINRCCHESFVLSAASALEAYVHKMLGVYEKNIAKYVFECEYSACKSMEMLRRDLPWARLRNPLRIPDDDWSSEPGEHILYFGRLVPEKGVEVLLRALKLLPPHMKAIIVGSGKQESFLRALSVDLGLANVEFVGPKWGDDLDWYLKRARVVVCPSTWHEVFPYVILQALAVGKAVVASDRGGIPEMLGFGAYGSLYPAESWEKLAEAIVDLWDDSEKRRALGRTARAHILADYNEGRFHGDLIDIYRSVV